jgi:hypothetical protein
MGKRARKKSQESKKPWIDLHLFQLPSPLQNVPDEVREKIAREMGFKFREELGTCLCRIEELITKLDPLYTLSHFAFYDLTLAEQSSEGGNFKARTQQPDIELLQALFLTLPQDQVAFGETPIPPIQELRINLSKTGLAFAMQRVGEKPSDSSVMVNEGMRMHTQGIRNWGYPSQIYKMLGELFQPLDDEVFRLCGIKPSKLTPMFQTLLKRTERALNDRRKRAMPVLRAKTVEKAVRTYYEVFAQDSDSIDKMLNFFREQNMDVVQAKWVMLLHNDQNLWESYAFTLNDCVSAYPDEITPEAMRTLLNLWSLSPGDLQHANKDHFFLNNPIWRRPIIKLDDDTYFWPLLQLFVAFGLEMIESVLAQFPEVLKKYQDKTRPKYLEDQTEALFRTALPKCDTFKGSMWKEYENDLLVLIDKTAIVVECKSGRVDPSARRGGQRLEQVVKELILEPSLQGARFADFLLNNRGPHVFKTKRGVENRCDTTKLLRVIRLNLTMEFLGPIVCQSRLLVKSGFIEQNARLGVTMSLFDLELVFEILEGTHQRLHYLLRRSEWESNVDYMADELDLLAFYMGTGFNVGEFEFEHSYGLQIYGLGEQFDDYFFAKMLGEDAIKPKLRLTQWWRDILKAAEVRAFDGWAEVGRFLLSADYKSQVDFEKRVKKMVRNVRANWHIKGHENTILMITGPTQRRTAIAAYGFKRITREERDATARNIIGRAHDESACEDVLLLGLVAEDKYYPYQFLLQAFGITPEPPVVSEADGESQSPSGDTQPAD